MEVTYIGYAPRESAWGRAALVLGEGPFSNYSPQKAHLSVQRGSPRKVVSFFYFLAEFYVNQAGLELVRLRLPSHS